ncbi:Breast cancer suppressor protein BRCT [Cordyceps militaris CM01]|uniref:Breast cancer suppressor protein BRCT n=1 Tax=Cordyceps militaris (strain CM01) TaxID=983644 RepID=G3JI29_CORMM|nr:Breast cancer suppressor protein BRCT [Cordyceps militaris CM01]EGX91832.1 Breast cancer suppressor protein BRCT [Cordyceps militaris CM01]
MDSPPKRITRARAAAKANASTAVRTTKIVTAAARAKAAGSAAASMTTATKRKSPSDDDDDEGEARARRLRGRPRRATGTAAVAAASLRTEPARTTRATRATRTTTRTSPVEQPPKEEPARPTAPARGRPRRNTATSTASTAKRTAATTGAMRSRPAVTVSEPVVNKSVKFDEPDKENMSVAVAEKDADHPHRLARSARRPPTPASKGAMSAAAADKKKPLSPRKVTQIPVLRLEEDLAGDGSPRRNGATEPVNVTPVKRSVDPVMFEKDADSTITVNAAILGPPEATTTVALGSPPRRPPASPTRDTFKSPAKKMSGIAFPGSPTKSNAFSRENAIKTGAASKNALFQTPAKRPPSPIKGRAFPLTSKPQSNQDAFKASLFQSPAKRAAPRSLKPVSEGPLAAICETPAMKPFAASTSVLTDSHRPAEKLTFEENPTTQRFPEEVLANPVIESYFNGRLSDVVPRDDADEGLDEDSEKVELVHTFSFYEQVDGAATPRLDMTPSRQSFSSGDSSVDLTEVRRAVTTPLRVATPQGASFQLRDKDVDPCHDMTTMSDSDDELGLDEDLSTFTPSFNKKRRSTMGLTSLAHTLNAWSSEGIPPANEAIQRASGLRRALTIVPVAEPSPMKTSFFEDQMQTQKEQDEDSGEIADGEISEPSFDEDIRVTGEDLALAQEAEDLSLLHESPCADRGVAKSFSDSLSEASQEYGDENELPVDPALNGLRMWPPATPARSVMRNCSTTTKVPLKPADESSPTTFRRFSTSRIPHNGTRNLSKSATVNSYSPEKTSSDVYGMDHEPATSASKCDMWSNMGTPACSPRRGASSPLLRGAVVFVDVHTSEGADASLIFVDLLTQMGAKCVKTWSWNPDGASHAESSSNRIGITHVVFKDGGKRTMEKVRRSNGVVQCVGVSWVLDCEKENEWLDESPYLVDTAFVPRGGARRRKSMEPKALANNNGTLVSTPAKQTSSYNRRQSGIWMQTPPEQTGGQEGEGDDIEWSEFILTPVPKTPNPEAISKYATNEPETPSQGNDSRLSPSREDMLMRTCPPKSSGIGVYDQLGVGMGMLSSHKDEKVLMRLMAARRKSLQFAPKIASPLSKSWY